MIDTQAVLRPPFPRVCTDPSILEAVGLVPRRRYRGTRCGGLARFPGLSAVVPSSAGSLSACSSCARRCLSPNICCSPGQLDRLCLRPRHAAPRAQARSLRGCQARPHVESDSLRLCSVLQALGTASSWGFPLPIPPPPMLWSTPNLIKSFWRTSLVPPNNGTTRLWVFKNSFP